MPNVVHLAQIRPERLREVGRRRAVLARLGPRCIGRVGVRAVVRPFGEYCQRRRFADRDAVGLRLAVRNLRQRSGTSCVEIRGAVRMQ